MSFLNELFDRLKKAARRNTWTWRLWLCFHLTWSVPLLFVASMIDSAFMAVRRSVETYEYAKDIIYDEWDSVSNASAVR